MSPKEAVATRYTAVVAIDFGTTRSGYRFAYTASPEKVWPNKNWTRAPAEGKTLTEILLKRSDFSFVAFGYEARDKFVSCENKDDYLYFSTFKMVLHNKEGAVRGTVQATNCDVSIPTELLISTCIRAIKERALEQLNTSKRVGIDFDKISWVVTVPAIWDVAARQAMSNAAEKAGININNVVIALEPEAAVLSCLADDEEPSIFNVTGNDFMVVDAGGGTVDITVHGKNSAGGIVELHSPSGGTWGSSYINKQFEEMLELLFGKALIDKARSTSDWYTIMDTFENAKINFSPENPVGNISVGAIIPKDTPDANFTNAINNYNTNNGTRMELTRGMLRIATVLPVLFEPIISNIINHVKSLLQKPALQKVRYLFLVGGFAECPILQSRMQQEFSNRLKVVIPPRPGASVMNGAVLYGLNPDAISERIMTQTIGIGYLVPWVESTHAGRQQAMGEGVRYCTEGFWYFVKMGDNVNIDHQVNHECIPIDACQQSMRISVYGSSSLVVNYHTDAGVRLLGYLDLDLPDIGINRHERRVDVVMKFGGTTFSVTGTYRKSGQSVNARFSFLLDEISQLANIQI